jgi:hypothetical protein
VNTAEARPETLRAGPSWQAFTGLLPMLLMAPLLLLDLQAPSVVLAAIASLGVIAYHLKRKQGLAPLDGISAGLAGTNLVLYVGMGSDLLVEHLDVVVYTLLLLTSASSLRRGAEPWTTQFTRRTLVPELWPTPAFRAMNVSTTRLWVAGFAACDAGAMLLPVAWQLWSPIAALIVTALASRRRGRTVLTRELQHSRRHRRPVSGACLQPDTSRRTSLR